jgi:hypothetical protein
MKLLFDKHIARSLSSLFSAPVKVLDFFLKGLVYLSPDKCANSQAAPSASASGF